MSTHHHDHKKEEEPMEKPTQEEGGHEEVKEEATETDTAALESTQENKTQEHEAPSFGNSWTSFKNTFTIWQKHWRIFTGIQIVWGAVMLAVMLLGGLVVGAAFGLLVRSEGLLTETTFFPTVKEVVINQPFAALGLLVIFLALAAAMVLVSAWMSLATVKGWEWVRHEKHEQMSVRNAYAATWNLIPRYIWVIIISTAITALGFIGFLIPGILMMLALSMIAAVVVYEQASGMQAVKRAVRLARPYLGVILWRGVMAGVILYLPGEILGGIFNAIADGIGDAITELYGLVVGPIMGGYFYLTYLQAKAHEKEEHNSKYPLEKIAIYAGIIALAIFAGLFIAGQL